MLLFIQLIQLNKFSEKAEHCWQLTILIYFLCHKLSQIWRILLQKNTIVFTPFNNDHQLKMFQNSKSFHFLDIRRTLKAPAWTSPQLYNFILLLFTNIYFLNIPVIHCIEILELIGAILAYLKLFIVTRWPLSKFSKSFIEKIIFVKIFNYYSIFSEMDKKNIYRFLK